MATPLTEAFKALNILNEDTFDYSKQGIDHLERFLDADNLEDTVAVIDTEAETEDELKDSYVGKVIFECPVCDSLNYHDKETVEIDEDDNLANIDEECPYCHSVGGFKIIGEVAPYHETEVEVETTEEEKIEEACGHKAHKRIMKEADKPAATSIEDAQKWVDYDMEKYGKISERTNALVKKAGFQIVKDEYGDYEVTAGHYEALKETKVAPRTRDDIDAIADDKKEVARARFSREKDNADSDRDYQLKRNKLEESAEDAVQVLGEDDYIFHEETGDIAITRDLANFAPGVYFKVKFEEDEGDKIYEYKMTRLSKDRNYIECEYIGTEDEVEEACANKRKLTEADDEEAAEGTEGADAQAGDTDGENKETGNESTDFQKLEVDLRNAKSYDSFLNKLKAIMANDAQFEVFKKGITSIDTSKATVQKGSVPVSQLIPTQSEIDASNSLNWFLNGGGTKDAPNEANVKESFKNLFSNPAFANKAPIIFNGKYIIDGHHRWSQEYCANPGGKIAVVDFRFDGDKSPIDALKRFQVAIAVTEKEAGKKDLPAAKVTEGLNIYSMDESSLTDYITKNISALCVEQTKQYVKGIEDEAGAIKYYVGNCLQLKNNNKPAEGAPNRLLMPQVSPAAKDFVETKPMTDLTENKHFSRPLHRALQEARDLTRAQGTIAKLLVDHASEINAAATSAPSLRDKLKEIVRADSAIDEDTRKWFEYTLDSKRSIGALLSTIATWMTGVKVNESLDSIELTTGTEKIKVTSEKTESASTEGEMITPVTADTANEIAPAEETEEETVETSSEEATIEPAEEGGTIEPAEEEEVSTEEVAELGESFLKSVYNNINSFKATNVSKKGNSFIVEGVINFKSGAKKPTKFSFSKNGVSKTGKVKYIGENLGITTNKKAFTLTGKRNSGKVMFESLTYNYGAKSSSGNVKRVYGRVQRKSK